MLPDVAEHVRHVFAVVRGRHPLAATRSYIADSWIRCSNDYQLDPASAREPAIVKADELAARADRLDDMVQIAKAEMRSLYQQLAGSGYAIMLTDRDGVLLDLCGDPQFTAAARHNGLIRGAVWSERFQGTNGVGTCLVERMPIYVHHNEHFLARYVGLTCSAAPIFDHHGNLIAVLDASGQSQMGQQHTLALVNMSAQMIENRSFIRKMRDRHLMRFHSRPEFVGTLHEGVIAFDPLGKVFAANRHASFQLGLAQPHELVGKPIADLFETTLSHLCEISTRRSFHPTPIVDTDRGGRFFAVAQRPQQLKRPTRQVPGGNGAAVTDGEIAARRAGALDTLHYNDSAMSQAISSARRLSAHCVPIVFYGETGVGKNQFAQLLHQERCDDGKPLVVVHCASLNVGNFEQVLFGTDQTPGKLPQAHGGSLLLDEPAELPMAVQALLLPLFESDGAGQDEHRPHQWLLATRFDLSQRVDQGLMRADFYYRICGATVALPALRQRRDAGPLTEQLLMELLNHGETVEVAAELTQWLVHHSWPGNVRQLRQTLATMLALRASDCLTLTDLPQHLRGSRDAADSAKVSIENHRDASTCALVSTMALMPVLADGNHLTSLNSLAAAERAALLRELELHHWGISKAARALGISRNTLYRRMERLQLKESAKRH